MHRPIFATALAAALGAPLYGCHGNDPATVALPTTEYGSQSADVPLPEASASALSEAAPASTVPPPTDAATRTFSALTAFAPSTDRDPAVVVAKWAKAVELKDWRTVRAYWGNGGEQSGMAGDAFEKRWGRLHDPHVTLGKGEADAGAGSQFYTVPVRIDDGGRAVQGTISLRRVNDVPGASAEQRRWHIERSTLPL